jgi:hypothetical protein
VYQIMNAAAPDEILFQLYHSTFKPVQERMRNYYQKYLPLLQEITPEEWATVEGKPGTPKYNKARDSFIAIRLDRKVKKPPVPEAVPRRRAASPAAQQLEHARDRLARRGRQGFVAVLRHLVLLPVEAHFGEGARIGHRTHAEQSLVLRRWRDGRGSGRRRPSPP